MDDGSEVVDRLETGPVLGEDDDDLPRMMSDELSALRRALFGKGLSTGREWDDVLNFVPNSCHMVLILWENVLLSYTDEIVGDLGPLVTAARQELQSASTSQEGASANGLQAARRLQRTLAHVHGSPKQDTKARGI
ncbi:hypothetical protein GGR55DRAFT_675280 [Xylaria sp. FL0064]|nr:hypothetical protein GGR55DRAFT_675280 [Xylaria sp. FL0064]